VGVATEWQRASVAFASVLLHVILGPIPLIGEGGRLVRPVGERFKIQPIAEAKPLL
jgi:hypothetical protein